MYVAGTTRSANLPLAEPGSRPTSGALDGFVAQVRRGRHARPTRTYHGGNGSTRWKGSPSTAAGNVNTVGSTTLDQPAGAERLARRPRAAASMRFFSRFAAAGDAAFLHLLRRHCGNDVGRAVAVVPLRVGRSSRGSTASPDFPVVAADPADVRRRARCLPGGGLADRRHRLVDLLRRDAQRTRAGRRAEPERQADFLRPDLFARPAAGAPGAASHRRQPRHVRRRARSALQRVHLRDLPGRQQQRRG